MMEKQTKTSFIKHVCSTCATTNRVSWQCQKSQLTRPGKSEELCSNPGYYLLFIHFALLTPGHADQHKFALPFRVCLNWQKGGLPVGLPHVRALILINKGMCVRAGLAAFAKFRAVSSMGSPEKARSPGSYKAGDLLRLCWSCLPTTILEGKSPEASPASCNAAGRQT